MYQDPDYHKNHYKRNRKRLIEYQRIRRRGEQYLDRKLSPKEIIELKEKATKLLEQVFK